MLRECMALTKRQSFRCDTALSMGSAELQINAHVFHLPSELSPMQERAIRTCSCHLAAALVSIGALQEQHVLGEITYVNILLPLLSLVSHRGGLLLWQVVLKRNELSGEDVDSSCAGCGCDGCCCPGVQKIRKVGSKSFRSRFGARMIPALGQKLRFFPVSRDFPTNSLPNGSIE